MFHPSLMADRQELSPNATDVPRFFDLKFVVLIVGLFVSWILFCDGIVLHTEHADITDFIRIASVYFSHISVFSVPFFAYLTDSTDEHRFFGLEFIVFSFLVIWLLELGLVMLKAYG